MQEWWFIAVSYQEVRTREIARFIEYKDAPQPDLRTPPSAQNNWPHLLLVKSGIKFASKPEVLVSKPLDFQNFQQTRYLPRGQNQQQVVTSSRDGATEWQNSWEPALPTEGSHLFHRTDWVLVLFMPHVQRDRCPKKEGKVAGQRFRNAIYTVSDEPLEICGLCHKTWQFTCRKGKRAACFAYRPKPDTPLLPTQGRRCFPD